MNRSALASRARDEVGRSGPALGHYRGSVFAGGMLWLIPILFLPMSVAALLRAQWLGSALMGVLGLGFGLVYGASWQQTVELFPTHLVWRKWGRARAIRYADIRDSRVGMRLDKAGSKTALFEKRYLDIHLHGGATLTLLEMSRHLELARQLDELVSSATEA